MSISERAHFFDAMEADGELYIPMTEFNGLFRKNADNKVEMIGQFGCDPIMRKDLFKSIIRTERALFFIPIRGREICSYDLGTGEIKTVTSFAGDVSGFCGCFPVSGGYVLVPNILKDGFYIFDPEKSTVKKLERLSERINNTDTSREVNWCDAFGSCAIDEKTIAVAMAETGTAAVIDLDDERVKTIDLGDFEAGNIIFFQNRLWFTAWKGCSVISYDLKTEEIQRYTLDDGSDAGRPFYEFAYHKDKLFILPCQGEWIWTYDAEENTWVRFLNPLEADGFKRVENYTLFFGWSCDENGLVLYPRGGNGILRINASDGSAELEEVIIPHDTLRAVEEKILEEQRRLVGEAINSYGILNEDRWDLTLEKFIDYVGNMDA